MNSQNFNLDALAAICSEEKIVFNRTTNEELEITIAPDCVLVFRNLIAEADTVAGFKGTPWHFHGTLHLMTGGSTYIEYNEQQIIYGIFSGDIVILSRYLSDKLNDRWLAHKDENIDIKYIEAGEEVRVKRLF